MHVYKEGHPNRTFIIPKTKRVVSLQDHDRNGESRFWFLLWVGFTVASAVGYANSFDEMPNLWEIAKCFSCLLYWEAGERRVIDKDWRYGGVVRRQN